MRCAFEINEKTYFVDVLTDPKTFCWVVVYDETKKIGAGLKTPFESLDDVVEEIVAKSKNSSRY